MNIAEALAAAKPNAESMGIAWKGLDIISSDEPGDVGGPDGLLRLYQRRTCQADAIVIGHARSWVHHVSFYGTAVYGDYDFAIDTVLKDNQTDPLRSKPDIVVTRPGGAMTLSGGPVNYLPQGSASPIRH